MIIVVDSIKLDSIKTKDFRAFLNAVKADGKSLVVTPAKDEIVVKSARNIPGVETTMANLMNVYDILKAKYLVLDKEGPRSHRGGVCVMANVYDIIIRPIITEQSMEATGTKSTCSRWPRMPPRSTSPRRWKRFSA